MVHPRTKKLLNTYGLYNKLKDAVKLTEPLGYFEFLKVLNNASKVLTDSGGIEKEAYILKVPCITLRTNTEWVETIQDGWNILAGADMQKIITLSRDFEPNHTHSNLFGNGACKKIKYYIGG